MKKLNLIIILIISCVFTTNNINAVEQSEKKFFIKQSIGYSNTELQITHNGTMDNTNILEKQKDLSNIIFGVGFQYKNFENSIDINYNKVNYNEEINAKDIEGILKTYILSYNINYLFKNKTIFTPYIGVNLGLQNFEVKFPLLKMNFNKFSYGLKIGNRFELKKDTYLDFNIQQIFKMNYSKEVSLGEDNNGKLKGYYSELSFNVGLLINF